MFSQAAHSLSHCWHSLPPDGLNVSSGHSVTQAPLPIVNACVDAQEKQYEGSALQLEHGEVQLDVLSQREPSADGCVGDTHSAVHIPLVSRSPDAHWVQAEEAAEAQSAQSEAQE